MLNLFAETYSSACFSDCGNYRYSLTREWDNSLPTACFCMLNPSTADQHADDPTIRRCISFAKTWGCGALEVVNLFAYRSTDPTGLRAIADPVGEENDRYIMQAAKRASVVVAAWGVHGAYKGRDVDVLPLLGDVQCLGVTKEGFPKHPLYVRADTNLRRFCAN
jgi:hypothetical protein